MMEDYHQLRGHYQNIVRHHFPSAIQGSCVTGSVRAGGRTRTRREAGKPARDAGTLRRRSFEGGRGDR
jgi:hypothetical protein